MAVASIVQIAGWQWRLRGLLLQLPAEIAYQFRNLGVGIFVGKHVYDALPFLLR